MALATWRGPGAHGGNYPPISRPWRTVYLYFYRWEQDKVTEQILPVVREQLRIQEGRNPQPSDGIIGSQTVKGAETVGRDSRGYDAGKKINGRKRSSSPTRWDCCSPWRSSPPAIYGWLFPTSRLATTRT